MQGFCIAGPVRGGESYLVPPLARAGLGRVRELIDASKYFMLHAPRQTGKTTALLALAAELRAAGLRAVYVNVEPAQTSRNDVLRGMQATISGLVLEAEIAGLPIPAEIVREAWEAGADAVHTAATGQHFELGALDDCWELTRGQPWLVNTLGHTMCFELEAGRDRSRPITIELVQTARQRLVLARATHIDQLAFRLEEERVRRVVTPLLAGEAFREAVAEDDVQYAIDLGLLTRRERVLEIANPIYREVLPRVLAASVEENLNVRFQAAWCRAEDGSLDLALLLGGFQDFFTAHAEHAWPVGKYREAEVQLVLQAYLQRVVNGGGVIEREYGLGRGRTDLFVRWPFG